MSCCKECNQKETKYRILQCDLEFQIKKMTEDLANEKVTLEMQYQRQSKKIVQRYNRERGEREEETRKWMQKYDQIVGQYEERIAHLNKEHQKKEKEIESLITTKYNSKQQQIKNNYDTTMQALQKSHELTLHTLESKLQASCIEARRQKQEQIRVLNQKHEEEMGCVVSDYDERIKQLKQQISVGLQNIDRLKLESHQKQTLLYEQLYQRKQEISALKYSVDQLNATIRHHEQQIHIKNLQMEVMKEQHEEQVRQMQERFEQEKEDIIGEFTSQVEGMLRGKLDDCCKFQQFVKEIEVKRENQVKLYESNLKEVREFVEERPSREEDLQQISLLRELLGQKEKEFQKALNEAKGYRLELNNKEEIFSKIFCSHSPLNIEKIGKRKDAKLPRTNSSIIKDTASKYQSVATFHAISTAPDLAKRERLVLQPKSTKFF